MKTKLLFILLIFAYIVNYAQTTAPTTIKWVKTDKITARVDTIRFDSVAKFNNDVSIKDTLKVNGIYPYDSTSVYLGEVGNNSVLIWNNSTANLGSINAYMGTYKGVDYNAGNYYKNGVWYRSTVYPPLCFFQNLNDSTFEFWAENSGTVGTPITWTARKAWITKQGDGNFRNVDANDTVFVGNDSIYNIRISNDTLYFNKQIISTRSSVKYSDSLVKYVTPSQLSDSLNGASTGFKWVVTGGGTDKIYTTVQAASAGDVVIVDAGAYTEANTISKNGVRLHFMNGAVVTKTTSGALLDITGYNTDFIVTGDAEFNLTNSLFLVTSTTAVPNTYLEYAKASNTGAGVHLINLPNTNELTGGITINGKISSTSSGGICISIVREDALTYLDIRGGSYSSTAGYCMYLGSNGVGLSRLNINCNSITTAHATEQALYSVSNYSNMNIVSNIISGVNALYISPITGDTKFFTGNITAEIVGNVNFVSTTFNNVNINLYGKIRAATSSTTAIITTNMVAGYVAEGAINIYSAMNLCVLTSGSNGGTVNLYGNMEDCSFNMAHNLTYTIYGALKVKRNTSLGTFTSGTLINRSRIICSGSDSNSSSDDVFTFTLNGTKFYNYGEIVSKNIGYTSSTKALITLQSGILINSGLINNTTASATSKGIEITGNATFVHDGGRIITSGGASINNAASTLTIKNYNNYFTNIARSGAGTYTETITGGGTEIVDTDVTE